MKTLLKLVQRRLRYREDITKTFREDLWILSSRHFSFINYNTAPLKKIHSELLEEFEDFFMYEDKFSVIETPIENTAGDL